MLTPYYVTRFDCGTCGTFETGTPDRPDPAATCPWCDGELITTAQCRGMTSRPLPFTSDPRAEAPITDTSMDSINGNTREKRKRNHANGKSTGRPRSGTNPQSDYDRARYLQSKRVKGAHSNPENKKGRPRGNGVRPTYKGPWSEKDTRDYDHERYEKRKQDGRRPADPSGGPAE